MMLFNEDCLALMKSQTFEDLIKGKNVIIVTDPPFNVGYHYKTYKDNLDEEAYYDFLEEVFTMRDMPFVVVHYAECLYKLAFQVGMFPEKVVSWVYNSNTAKQHRDIAFFGVKPDFRKMTQPYKNPNDKRIRERIAKGCKGGRLYDWWEVNQVKNVSKKGNTHPCVMPLEVMKRIVGILPNGIVVFDPFMGSGTTGVACRQLGIDFIGCELDEEYFEIAKERISEEKRWE